MDSVKFEYKIIVYENGSEQSCQRMILLNIFYIIMIQVIYFTIVISTTVG